VSDSDPKTLHSWQRPKSGTESKDGVSTTTGVPNSDNPVKLEIVWHRPPDVDIAVGPIKSKPKRKGKRGERPATKERRDIIRSVPRAVKKMSEYCKLVDNKGLTPPWAECNSYVDGWTKTSRDLRDELRNKIKQERKNAWKSQSGG
jgi:hypothetical protein